MKLAILQWSPCLHNSSLSLSSPPFPSSLPFTPKLKRSSLISATLNSLQQYSEQHNEQQQQQQQLNEQQLEKLPARERRKLKNERRQSKVYDWKEEVEMKLIKKPKKRYASWTEELNLDTLAQLGPQWWVIRVSRATGQYSAEKLALSLSNNFPDMEFKMYFPAVQERRKLKNGSISVKPKPIFPGCVFFRCVLNKELHDFIRESEGIGGFIGSKVGNTKRQINKPRPVAEEDMDKVFQQAKEAQEKADLAFEDEQKSAVKSEIPALDTLIANMESPLDATPKSESIKGTQSARRGRKSKIPKIGATVEVVSGSFADFSGVVKKVDKKNGKVTVGFTLLGKETISDLEIHEIVVSEE